MDWTRDGADWPNRNASRFVVCRPHRWHVQVMGAGPVLLLLHGTGAATHSWRDLAPLLAHDFTVVAPDLPGHGFTSLGSRRRSSLPAMAWDVGALCDAMALAPVAVIGHSAGAAIALQMACERRDIGKVIGLNAALGSFDGPAAWAFPAMARTMAAAPFVPRAVAAIARATGGVDRMLGATGSKIDAIGRTFYERLVTAPSHIDGALEMMAQWSTVELRRGLGDIPAHITLLYGEKDRTVPPDVSREIAAEWPCVAACSMGPLGHLAHEEAPDLVADTIRKRLTVTAR